MQLFTSISGRETPLNGDMMLIASLLPGSNHGFHLLHRRQSLIQTLPSQDTQLDLGHVEPTAMLRRVMKLQPMHNAPSLFGFKGLIQGCRRVRVQVIQDHLDQRGLREVDIDQVFHGLSKILLGASLGDLHMSPAKVGLDKQKQITGPFTLIFAILSCRLAGLWRHRFADVIEQLIGTFIEADAWPVGITGQCIQIQHVLHVPNKFASYRGNAPLLLLPGFEHVFLSVRRTVSSEISSTMPTCTSRSASNCIVHLTWSLGGVLHAKAMRYASCFSSSFGLTPGRGRSVSAYSSPPSRYFLRVRSTVETPTPKAVAMSASCFPSSAKRRMWARANLRAAMVPFLVNAMRDVRSSSVNLTMYSFLGMASSVFKRYFTQVV